MDPKKFIITFAVISVSIFGSYFFMNGRSPIGQEGDDKTPSLEGVALDDGELSDAEAQALQNGGANRNFTELFGGALAQQLINKNSSDPNAIVGWDELLSEQAVQDFANSNLVQGNTSAIHPKARLAKYVVSGDVSSDAQLTYIRKVRDISISRSKDMRKTSSDILEEVSAKKDGTSATAAARLYGGIADEYARMTVPRNWVDFHKKLLSHFYSAQSVYDSIADFKEDPMKAYLAIQGISQLDMSAVAIQSLVAQGMKKNNLHF